ncbi:MAG: hypothetical protein NC203_09370 [Firmicutes bacterium]|nr:hypothetical protein [[Eubacterium] siraeum]MCM1488563.1 hypothetical protein [Bacillota bacterium]
MNGIELLERMSEVEEGLILESENCGKGKKGRRPLFIGLGTVAAAAAVALTVNFLGNISQRPPVAQELPILTAPILVNYGMGFEGYNLSDISEYNNGNPWTEDMDIKTMPVYKSNIGNPDREKMTEYLLSAAEKFGIDVSTLEITWENFDDDAQLTSYRKMMEEQNVPADEIETELERVRAMILLQANVYAKNDDLWLSVDGTYTVGVHYRDEAEILLPEEYRDTSTDEGKLNTAKYLLEQYKEIQGLTDPVIDIYKDDSLGFYDKGKTDAETIFNYSLNHSRFGVDEEGNLFVIWLDSTAGCEKLGDYPILSVKEAENELLSGNYLTSVPYDLQEGDKPVHTEITYRMDRGCDYALPYYRFLVEVPEFSGDDGTKCYGAYYVCAVSKEYISDPVISYNGAPIGQNGLGLEK